MKKVKKCLKFSQVFCSLFAHQGITASNLIYGVYGVVPCIHAGILLADQNINGSSSGRFINFYLLHFLLLHHSFSHFFGEKFFLLVKCFVGKTHEKLERMGKAAKLSIKKLMGEQKGNRERGIDNLFIASMVSGLYWS